MAFESASMAVGDDSDSEQRAKEKVLTGLDRAIFGAEVDTTDRTKQVAKCASVSLISVNSEEAVVDSDI